MAFVLSVGMHVAFFVVLFFAISWKTKPPAPVVAELWTPPPAAVPRPAPKPAPQPKLSPKVAPPPEPKVEEKPPEKVDIALEQEKERKRLEEERKRLEAIELKRRKAEEARKRAEAEQKRKEEAARAEAEQKRKEEAARAEAEQKRKEEEARAKAEQEKKVREERIAADKRFKAALESETRERMARELAKAPAQPGRREGVAASAPGDPNALAGYSDKISAKIRGNVILPPTLSGDPEAEFRVEQLPTGEILSVKLTRSSGNKALDDAWERAILKSSPLPLPEQREVFQSTLRLKFRPSDKR
jgi:colicin import membrane protein